MADQIWGQPRRSIGGMNPRPIIAALVTIIVLLAVALFVLFAIQLAKMVQRLAHRLGRG